MEIQDFSNHRHFPGTEGNPFDRWLRLLEDMQKLPAWVFAAGLFILAWIPSFLDPVRALSLFGFYILDWLLIALLPRFKRSFGPPRPTVFILSVLRLPFAFLPLPIHLSLQVLGTLLVVYGFWIEPHRLVVTRQSLQTGKLPTGSRLRVLHIGDLHIERLTQREKKLNQYIEEMKPDLILFSGDILNLSYLEDPTAIRDAKAVINEWRAPLGVFFVSGSEAVDLVHVFPSLVDDEHITWLDNQVAIVEKDGAVANVIGVTCSHRPHLDAPVLDELLENSPDHFNILIYHSPDLAPNAARLGVDLQLSGHTHGGQVRLPWFGPLYTASLYGRKFQSGRYQIGDLVLYITRGVGLEGKAAPRVRFFCPPEIILWEISGQPPSTLSSIMEEPQ